VVCGLWALLLGACGEENSGSNDTPLPVTTPQADMASMPAPDMASDMANVTPDMAPDMADEPEDMAPDDLGVPDLGPPDMGAPDMDPPDMGAPDMPMCMGQCVPDAPSCVGDVIVASTAAEFDQDCMCVQTTTMTDCAASNQVCEDVDGTPTCVTPPPPIVCPADTTFTGQIGGTGFFDGGRVGTTDASLSMDSNLDDVYDYIAQRQAAGTLPMMGSFEVPVADRIQVQGAMVTSTRADFGDFTFDEGFITFQDRQRAMLGFIELGGIPALDANGNPLALKVGDRVNFTVTRVTAFGGVIPQISAITDVRVIGTMQQVYVRDVTPPLTIADWSQIVRMGGQIAGVRGACGGSSTCYDLQVGQQTLTFRSSQTTIGVGDCVTFVGPVSSVPGPLGMKRVPQLDGTNCDCVRIRPSP